ncbi:PilX N-terminal domain-containing pilus assembly protein [Halomonas sp.]|uniref:pilus assembly PilX family protein n=1 Tax=Halomonas sp. TaxID=1486246 RepID=UPI00384AA85A
MKHQEGAALVVVMSLLTVSLMLGLSSMQSSQVDERLAGNYKAKSEAQMAAEIGASEGFEDVWGAYKSNSAGWKLEFKSLVAFLDENEDVNIGGLFSGWDGFEAFGELREVSSDGEEKWAYSLLSIPNHSEIPVPAGDYVVSVGVAREGSDAGNVISQSEFVFARVMPAFAGFDSALTILGGIANSEQAAKWQPNSAQAEVTIQDGEDTITLSSLAYEHPEKILDVDEDVFDSGILHYGEASNQTTQTVKSIYDSVVASNKPNAVIIDDNIKTSGGSDKNNGITYNGDTIGECFEEGKGNNAEDQAAEPAILIVTGDLDLGGGTQFCGILISLGGAVTMGGNVVVNGMLLAANYPKDKDGEIDFSGPSDPVDINFSGGGNAGSVKFDEQTVRDAIEGVIDWSSFIGTGVGIPRIANWW